MAYEGYTHHGSITCHTHPTMTLDYGVNDDGNYVVTVNKPNSEQFGYQWTVKLNDTSDIIIKSVSDGNEKEWNKTCTGNCGSVFKLSAVCAAGTSGCAMGGNYILVNTINLHTHSAPTGFKINASDIKQTSVKISWSRQTDGCSGINRWGVKGGPYSDYYEGYSGKDDSPIIKNLTPGTKYTFTGYCKNEHDQMSNTDSVTIRTKYATPEISASLDPNNTYKNNPYVSVASGYFKLVAKNTASHTGELTWKVEYKKSGDSSWKTNTNKEYGIFHINIDPKSTYETGGLLYYFRVTATNEDGSSSDSVEFYARSKYNTNNFEVTNTIQNFGLEHIKFKTECKNTTSKENCIAEASYSVTLDGHKKTSSMDISNNVASTNTGYVLYPSTNYKFTINIITTTEYDDIEITTSFSATTDAKNKFTQSLGNCNFQLPGTSLGSYSIQCPSGNNAMIVFRIYQAGNDYITLNRIEETGSSKTITLDFTDQEWDIIYKNLPKNKNAIAYKIDMYTYSNKFGTYPINDNRYLDTISGSIILTGNKKTTYVGRSGPKRARVYIGDSSKNIRKAVCWIGIKDNDGVVRPHRTI